MSKRYTGIDARLESEVKERDRYRCRWCGATNRGVDLHHIEYRRGYSYDRLDNLICLCRLHHGFVHGTPAANGARITKDVAQQVLRTLVERPGTTGMSVWRSLKRRWALEGRCEKHGQKKDECLDCHWESRGHAACVECGNDLPSLGYDKCTDCLEEVGP